MCKLSIVITWYVPGIRFLLPTWDFSGGAANFLRSCQLSARTLFPTSRPENSKLGHLFMKMWRA